MLKKINVGILYGGKSAEHEVSLLSTQNVIKALDLNQYSPVVLKIEKDGDILPLLDQIKNCDVIFPILHGPFGEDGTIQGLLKLLDKPFVGSGVLGSAIGMDKEVMKRLLIQANIPVTEYVSLRKNKKLTYDDVSIKLSKTLFIKPANMGSSVGVSKVTNKNEFAIAVSHAFLFDTKILIEKAMEVREIECSMLGNDNPQVSQLGEIIIQKGFYSYEEKYSASSSASTQIPADISESITEEIKSMAIKTFQTLECSGMARVDFFIEKKTNKIYVNEINTIPGFTNISMYPKMWETSGITYQDLIGKLIQFAIEKHSNERSLKTSINE